jgi:hypothetical protein
MRPGDVFTIEHAGERRHYLVGRTAARLSIKKPVSTSRPRRARRHHGSRGRNEVASRGTSEKR